MQLKSLILRADGVLARVEHLRFQAFSQVFEEAGLKWSVDVDSFSKSRQLGCPKTRLGYFVEQQMRGKPQSSDVSDLIAAMQRRGCKLFSSLLHDGKLEPRAVVRDLVVAAAQEGIVVAVLSGLSEHDTNRLIDRILGGLKRHVSVVWHNANTSETDGYDTVSQDVRFTPANTLVIENGLRGAKAARAQGYQAIRVRDPFCKESWSSEPSNDVVENLSELLRRDKGCRLDPLTADERATLVAVLSGFLAGRRFSTTVFDGSNAMRVHDLLEAKGTAVRTIEPTATVRALAHSLKSAGVGAMVVRNEDHTIAGIVTERDIARGVADFGPDLSRMSVAELMTKDVITCRPEDSVSFVARLMTQRRIRHVPVVVDGKLMGLISIGDALAHRVDEVQLEANVLRDYALARK